MAIAICEIADLREDRHVKNACQKPLVGSCQKVTFINKIVTVMT